MKALKLMPFAGAQTTLLSFILKRIPSHRIYVEVFGGSAMVLLNKPPSQIEVYNDVDGELTNLFEVIRRHPRAFKLGFKFLLNSPHLLSLWRNEELKDPIEKAIRTYYFYYCFRFPQAPSWRILKGERWGGTHIKTMFRSLLKIEKIYERIKNIYVDNSDFRDCFKRWDSPNTFFFCDPPYWDITLYKHEFSKQDHFDLRNIVRKLKGKWLITYGDGPEIRRLYLGYHFEKIYAPYLHGTRRTRQHLFISNYRGEEI